MYKIIRAILFRLPAELSHDLALKAMRLAERCGVLSIFSARFKLPPAPVTVMGVRFPHRVGLAAGLDKNADYADALQALGFGWLELGTMTPRQQPGNPKPRMFRLAAERAIINRLGFNNKGLEQALANVAKRRRRGVVGINIGKNFDTPI